MILELKKNIFYHFKSPIFSEDVDIDNVLVSNKISSGEKNYKYFIGYLYDDFKVKPLHIMVPKTSANVRFYDNQRKWKYFSIEDGDLLEKYNIIWDKFIVDIRI